MKGSIKSLEEAKIFIQGCTLLGTGGGGFPEEGLRVLKEALDAKGKIEWRDVGEISDDDIAICTFLMGSTAPMTDQKKSQMVKLGLIDKKYPTNMMNAIEEWEKYTNKKVDIVVPLEVGGSNLPAPMAVATMMGKSIVDGDYAGRAIPEIFQISIQKEEINLCPAVSFDKYGNVCIIKDAMNLTIAERIGKYLMGIKLRSTSANMETINQIINDLSNNFNLNIITFLPVLITMVLSVKKVHPLIAMYSGVVAGSIISMIFQGTTLAGIFTHLNYGFSIEGVNDLLMPILNRGGLQSMMWTASLAIIVISLAGILQGAGYLNAIVKVITKNIDKPAPMITAAIVTAMFITMVTGDSYSAILLTGTLFVGAFDRIGLDRSILSRCTEEGGTLFVAIVPWATSGAYFTAILGVPTLEYLPFTILAWLNPIISILFASAGKALIFRDKEGNKIEKGFFSKAPKVVD
jgi:hypothetical protein